MKNSRFIVRLTFRWCPKPNLTQLPGNLFSIIIRIGPNQSGAIIVRYIQFLNIHNFPIVIDKQLQVLFRTQIDFISTTIDCSGKISEWKLQLEPQTVYVMFSVDRIEGKLYGTGGVNMIQYNAGGLIPQ